MRKGSASHFKSLIVKDDKEEKFIFAEKFNIHNHKRWSILSCNIDIVTINHGLAEITSESRDPSKLLSLILDEPTKATRSSTIMTLL